jgi:hypothetical protein
MKSLKSILAGILVGASTLAGTVQAGETQIPRPYVETAFVSAFVSPAGTLVNEDCRQDWASITAKGLTLGIWQAQFSGESGIAERDYCASYAFPIASNLTANVGFQYWDYPNKRFGQFDSVEKVGLDYSGKVNASLHYAHLNENSATDDGGRLCLKLSKPLALTKDKSKTKVTLTPSVAGAWIDNWYGRSGISHVTPGVSLSVSRNNFSVNGFFNSQVSLNKNIENLNWGGVSLGYQF